MQEELTCKRNCRDAVPLFFVFVRKENCWFGASAPLGALSNSAILLVGLVLDLSLVPYLTGTFCSLVQVWRP